MHRIYFDNDATTQLRPEVLDAMLPYFREGLGNASSLHREGRLARRAVESAREVIAELLDAAPEQVIFTSGGTEANNLAVFGLAGESPCHVVTSPVEHASVRGCFARLEDRGFPVARLPVDSRGLVPVKDLARSIRPDTRLVSVMLVNNETGAIQPVAELAKEARRVPFHTDAVQAVGKMPVSFRSLGVTSLSLSAHKFHGPLGVGALLVRQPQRLQALLVGGHQESGVRPGTEPVALIIGMAKALELAVRDMNSDAARVRRLRDDFEEGLRQRLGAFVINGPTHNRLWNTSNLTFSGLDAQAAVLALDLQGLACSTGSACASGAAAPSQVLLAMGLSEPEVRGSLRFSLSRFTTSQEVERAVELVSQVVLQQRQPALVGVT